MQKRFILGGNKVGKTTMAKKLEAFYISKGLSPSLYEAGAWCRKIHKERFGETSYENQMNPEFRQQLYDITNEFLVKDKYHSVKAYKSWVEENTPSFEVLIGLRNVMDFQHMLDKEPQNNACIFLADEGQLLDDYLQEMINICKQNDIPFYLLDPNKYMGKEEEIFTSLEDKAKRVCYNNSIVTT